MFCDKRSLSTKIFLSVITKNLNWETLTRIQLLLKGGMGLKMENVNIMQVHQKGGHKKPIYREELTKKEGLGQFADSTKGAWQKRGQCILCRLLAHQVGFFYPAFFELV